MSEEVKSDKVVGSKRTLEPGVFEAGTLEADEVKRGQLVARLIYIIETKTE